MQGIYVCSSPLDVTSLFSLFSTEQFLYKNMTFSLFFAILIIFTILFSICKSLQAHSMATSYGPFIVSISFADS